MANPEKGELALTVGDRTYTLITDFDAQCQVEKLLSDEEGRPVPFVECAVHASRFNQRYIRAVFWGSLRRHHPEISVKQAGELIEAAGGSEKMLETVQELRAISEPEGESRPPKARQSTTRTRAGARTTSTRGGSASALKTSGG